MLTLQIASPLHLQKKPRVRNLHKLATGLSLKDMIKLKNLSILIFMANKWLSFQLIKNKIRKGNTIKFYKRLNEE